MGGGSGNSVCSLVLRARSGDQRAWAELVDKYAALTWVICRRYRLSAADTEDVGQSVWLQLVDHLDTIREPAAIPGWLATTTRRECQRLIRTRRTLEPVRDDLDGEEIPDVRAPAVEYGLLTAERHAALREAFDSLSPRDQRFMSLLIEDPPLSYAEISNRLGIPVGSIGPHRGRCLDKLRQHPAIAALISASLV